MDAEKASFPVSTLCRSLDVSRSGYYAARERGPSMRDVDDQRLRLLIRDSHLRSKRTYGWPRVLRDLRDAGEYVSPKRVSRLMRAEGLRARQKKRFRKSEASPNDQPLAPNLLDRDFTAGNPNERWVSDTTELVAGSSRLFLAAILDLFSRFVVGWAVSTVNDRHLTMRAFETAWGRRCPATGLLHHSDRGSPYTAEDYQEELLQRGMVVSMSRKGDCFDNAAMESFFSTLKHELGERFESVGEAKRQLFDYIEMFYNQKRRHSTLGYVSPAEFERASARTARELTLNA